MCRESKRITPFEPKPLTPERKAQYQDISRYNITNRDANQRNLARWYQKVRNGAWDRENFEENFGDTVSEV